MKHGTEPLVPHRGEPTNETQVFFSRQTIRTSTVDLRIHPVRLGAGAGDLACPGALPRSH